MTKTKNKQNKMTQNRIRSLYFKDRKKKTRIRKKKAKLKIRLRRLNLKLKAKNRIRNPKRNDSNVAINFILL